MNFRRLKRDSWQVEQLVNFDFSNKERRKWNRHRYQEVASFRKSVKVDSFACAPYLCRWGKSAKLVSSRRFINLHQNNF